MNLMPVVMRLICLNLQATARDKLATLAGAAHVLNWLPLPAVFVVVAVIFASAVALDFRRQRAAHLADEAE
jgi:hypothetical protein